MSQRNLDDYVSVAERVVKFYEAFPEGSLQTEILEYDGKHVLVKAFAYRDHNDRRPGIGHAEEIRTDGPVNKTSMVENAETSAWGRAIAAFGFEVRKGVASREEMEKARRQAREAEQHERQARLDKELGWDQKKAEETITAIEEAVANGNGKKKLPGALNAQIGSAVSERDQAALERILESVRA